MRRKRRGVNDSSQHTVNWEICRGRKSLTLFDAVLLGTLVITALLLSGDALDALVEVVLEGGALGGIGAF